VAKAQSVGNMDVSGGEGMRLYAIGGGDDNDDNDSVRGGRATAAMLVEAEAPGQTIVRSKSASLLNDQTLQVYPGCSASSSASSSDLLSSSHHPKPLPPAAVGTTTTSRYPASSTSSMALGLPPPQYNIQYSSSSSPAAGPPPSSAAGPPRDGLWTQRTPVPPPEHQGYLQGAPQQNSLANTNYSNRNQAPPPGYPLQPQPRAGTGPKIPAAGDMIWGKERLQSSSSSLASMGAGGPGSRVGVVGGSSSTLQRQSSSASAVSVGRYQLPEGEYMTYRDIHTLGRGPLAMSHALQRPLSARTYSMDAPGTTGRPLGGGGRQQQQANQLHLLPERTMSVSDFNHQQQQLSPGKRPGNGRVRSEHSLLDGPLLGGPGSRGGVPTDWRDQVMRHIEAKKMEKVK